MSMLLFDVCALQWEECSQIHCCRVPNSLACLACLSLIHYLAEQLYESIDGFVYRRRNRTIYTSVLETLYPEIKVVCFSGP